MAGEKPGVCPNINTSSQVYNWPGKTKAGTVSTPKRVPLKGSPPLLVAHGFSGSSGPGHPHSWDPPPRAPHTGGKTLGFSISGRPTAGKPGNPTNLSNKGAL
ncbi:hypothetical protein CRENBAI_026711 [Crenichthys baileyi]|uniref:Uncharacterized protein n=1 Tax=Crenichthys baileyi TaxID=28760 RepID=A0AAV9SP46_9TELE